MYQSVFGSAASRVATFVCFCHETLFCIFVPPRLPFPALHLSSQAPRCFSPLLETVTFSVDLSQTSSPPGVCGTFFKRQPQKSDPPPVSPHLPCIFFHLLLISSALSAYFLSQSLRRHCFPQFHHLLSPLSISVTWKRLTEDGFLCSRVKFTVSSCLSYFYPCKEGSRFCLMEILPALRNPALHLKTAVGIFLLGDWQVCPVELRSPSWTKSLLREPLSCRTVLAVRPGQTGSLLL